MAATVPRITQALKDAIANPAAASPVHAAAQLSALSTGDAEQRVVAELAQEVGRLRRDFDDWRRGEEPNDLLIEELEVGVRSYNSMKRAGIQSVQDLLKLTKRDLAAVPNMNSRSVDEVVEALSSRGLSFREQ